MDRPRYPLGIALGGGAARGLFHVGALKALHEGGIVPDVVAGTSVGAMIGAAYAGRPDVEDLEFEIRKIRWDQHVFDFGSSLRGFLTRLTPLRSGKLKSSPGFVRNSTVVQTINALVNHEPFARLMPLILTGTDIETCQRILFCAPDLATELAAGLAAGFETSRFGREEASWRTLYDPTPVVVPFEDVGLAARISGCFPGVMTSVEMELTDVSGETRTRVLNDGGVLDQIPVTPLRTLGCERVIAIHIGFVPFSPRVTHLMGVAQNAVQGVANAMIARSLDAADVVIYDPEIENVPMHVLDGDVIDQGYRFVRRNLETIRAALPERGTGARRGGVIPMNQSPKNDTSAELTGELVAVNIASRIGHGKTAQEEVELVEGVGARGDAHAGKKSYRQLSLLGVERIAELESRGLSASAGSLGENLTTRGIELEDLPLGARLTIGNGEGESVLEISHRGKFCGRAMKSLGTEDESILEIDRVYAAVVKGGTARSGQAIRVQLPPPGQEGSAHQKPGT